MTTATIMNENISGLAAAKPLVIEKTPWAAMPIGALVSDHPCVCIPLVTSPTRSRMREFIKVRTPSTAIRTASAVRRSRSLLNTLP